MDNIDHCKNKVYINPNFNKPVNNLPSNVTMYVNPKFTHLVSNVQSTTQTKSKIYVNPNFIKAKSFSDVDQCISSNATNNVVTSDKQNAIYASNSMGTRQQLIEEKEVAHQVPISQSRYCLIKHNVTNKLLKEPGTEKCKSTFKINKYKSVPWNDIKTNLNSVKKITNNIPTFATRTETNFKSVDIGSKSKFRFINSNNFILRNQDRIKMKTNINEHSKLYKTTQVNHSRMKKVKGNLKKNNIPCPLFRKYGRCLRIDKREKCEFLHDKKHVSVCRKFIKGLCHDKDCLLSHDLTSKKMPTCYFYLQGTCTKTDCPYLHVKLNEKAKICLDFLKGYCEKGSKCLQRHINVSNKKNKVSSHTLKSSINNKSNSKSRNINLNNKDRRNEERFQNVEIQSQESSQLLIKSESNSEYRYYKEKRDNGSINELCEVIKPSRCKLGILPSFIQL